MLDKFLVLLERFVVAHELLAIHTADIAKSKTQSETEKVIALTQLAELGQEIAKELPVEGEEVIDTKPKRGRSKPAPKPDDLEDEEPAPVRKPKKPEVDIEELRSDIKVMAKSIAAGDSDECADLFDELLDTYNVRTVTKLKEDEVAKFHAEAKLLVSKYYEIED